ncbi:MAG: TetR/AcrR family transcriptional regulator [Eubacteriales bacterium]|nr:TetR/AcrR family transcriptional regulator [Eubacteriales bacterium]
MNNSEKSDKMEQIQNEKVLAMFQAVCDLIDDGMEIEKIKVSDVTQRAGIGKGTAYEYFRSKEELLFQALQYDFLMQFQTFHSELINASSFYDAIMSGFEWMEGHACNNRMKVQFLQLTQIQNKQGKKKNFIENEKVFDEDVLKDCFFVDTYHEILNSMIKLGIQEKIIDESIPQDMIELDIFSRYIEYFMFMKMRPSDNEEVIGKMRKFLYEGMIKQYETRI